MTIILRIKAVVHHKPRNQNKDVSYIEKRALEYNNLFTPTVRDVDIRVGHMASGVFIDIELEGHFTMRDLDAPCQRVVREMGHMGYADNVREVERKRYFEVLEE